MYLSTTIRLFTIILTLGFISGQSQHTDFRGEFKRFHISSDNLPPSDRNTDIWAYVCDSYGDGWNGNTLIVGGWSSEGPAQGIECEWQNIGELNDGNHAVICDGGTYQHEVTWIITDGAGNQLLSGGAPYEGNLCIGSCDDNGDDDPTYPDVDCEGQPYEGHENWIGDGYCDDGSYGFYFDCAAFNCDEGDCDDCDVSGCMDETAENFNENATLEDGSCEYSNNGNNDLCWQFNELTGGYEYAACDDAGGGFDIDNPGCMDPYACNYNEDAEIDDGSCQFPEHICWDNSVVCSSDVCPEEEEEDSGHYVLNDMGQSSTVLMDVINPTVSITSIDNQTTYSSGETITIEIEYYETNLGARPIAVYISTDNSGEFDILDDNLTIDNITVTLPQIDTDEARLKVILTDAFGNTDNDESNYFTIGNPQEEITIDHYSMNDKGQSILTLMDVMPPSVTLIYPNGNEEFDRGEDISVSWEYEETYPSDTPFNIFLSEDTGQEFYPVATGIPLVNSTDITLPNINTANAQLKITIVDYFGNHAEDFSDATFSIGSTAMDDIEHYSINDVGQSVQTTMDVVDPEISISYPNGGEHLTNYQDAPISCPVYDDHLDQTGLSIEVSFELGGWFVEVASDIDPAYASDYNVDLSNNGEIPERIYGLMRATISDRFGNTKTDVSNGYFILGDPRGDININYIDEEETTVLVDWSWIENQVIAISEQALESVTNFDYIKIYDESGINTDYCDENEHSVTTGMVELATIDISEETGSKTVNLPCGFDYCSQGGSRIIGYSPGSTIKFSAGFFQDEEEYELSPASAQLIGDDEMIFDNSTQVITSFTIGNRINIDNDQILSIDEREIDNFNVYSRVTNHSGSINRTCNNNGICEEGEALANCFADCCSEPGTGLNDEWCFEENLQGISTYYSNLSNNLYLPNNQGTATINYRIWLLDQNGDEAVVTLDTEGIQFGGDGDLSTVYEQTLNQGWNWFSFNVYPDDMNVNSVFSQFLDEEWQCDYGAETTNCPNYIKSQDGFAIYYDGYGFHPPFTMDVITFYKLYMNAPSQLLFQGTIADPSTEISLIDGWNWVGYIPLDPLNVNTGLANIIANNTPEYIKSQSGFAIFYNDFGFHPNITMESHGGYMLQMQQPDVLIYPSSDGLFTDNTDEIYRENNLIWDFNHRDYEFSASATLEIDIENLEVSEDDQIAVFNDNECIGIATPQICPFNDRLQFSLMYYSNQESENNLSIQYYNAFNNEIYDIRETIDFISDANFGDAFTPIMLHDSDIPTEFRLEAPYPNPFNPVTTINFQIADNVDDINVSVYDISGRLVETLYTGSLNAGYHSYKWNAEGFASGIYFVQMITNEHRFSQKITLLK